MNSGAAPATVAIDELAPACVVKMGHIVAENPAAVSEDFSVSTDWGDGTSPDTAGFVVPTDDNGGFDVYATYTGTTSYAGGSSPIQVTVAEDSSKTAVPRRASIAPSR